MHQLPIKCLGFLNKKTEDQVMILKMMEGKDGKKTAPAP